MIRKEILKLISDLLKDELRLNETIEHLKELRFDRFLQNLNDFIISKKYKKEEIIFNLLVDNELYY